MYSMHHSIAKQYNNYKLVQIVIAEGKYVLHMNIEIVLICYLYDS